MTCYTTRRSFASPVNRFPVKLWYETFLYLRKSDFHHLLIAASSSISQLKLASQELRLREWTILQKLFPEAQSEPSKFFSLPPKALFTALLISPSSLIISGLTAPLPPSLFCCPAQFIPALKIMASPPLSIQTISPLRSKGDPITVLVLARMTQRDQCAVFGWVLRMLPLSREEARPLVEAIKDLEIRLQAQKYFETLPSLPS